MLLHVELWGSNNVGNYFHYLQAGHFLEFLLKNNGNIMRFANQGWESLNGKLKHAMSSKTQRGGHCGTASTESLIKSAYCEE